VIYRFRRNAHDREYVGHYRFRLVRGADGALKIAERRAILDSEELGPLGSVSFIL
jgi:p-cumate 2,3-dioxygenase subunit beta